MSQAQAEARHSAALEEAQSAAAATAAAAAADSASAQRKLDDAFNIEKELRHQLEKAQAHAADHDHSKTELEEQLKVLSAELGTQLKQRNQQLASLQLSLAAANDARAAAEEVGCLENVCDTTLCPHQGSIARVWVCGCVGVDECHRL